MGVQGWFVDPFQIHDARWMSDGRPTALVRDGNKESNDPPPTEDFPGPLLRSEQLANQPVIIRDSGVHDNGVYDYAARYTTGQTPPRRGFWANLLDLVLSIIYFVLPPW